MLIMGCDLHTRYQEIALLDSATGEMVTRRLEHENGEARAFYASLAERALVGIEATGCTLCGSQSKRRSQSPQMRAFPSAGKRTPSITSPQRRLCSSGQEEEAVRKHKAS